MKMGAKTSSFIRENGRWLVINLSLIFVISLVFLVIKGDLFTDFGTGRIVSLPNTSQDLILGDSSVRQNLKLEDVFLVSNEILIRVKKSVSIREDPSNMGVASLNRLNKKYRVKKIERVTKQPGNSKINSDLFRWYKITLDQKGGVLNTKHKKSSEVAYISNAVVEYLKDPNIEDAEFNYIYNLSQLRRRRIMNGGDGDGGTLKPNDPYYHSSGSWGQPYYDLWGIRKLNLGPAWEKVTDASSVVVADIDTGVDRNHPDLKDNMWVNVREIPNNGVDDDNNNYVDDYYGWDFYYDDNDPIDENGHGTHTVGTIAAIGNNGIGIVGVNWKAKIMALKIFPGNGGAPTDVIVRALQYSADMGARVSSNSYGGYGRSSVMEDAISYAYDKGMIIIAAAGNNDIVFPSYPAGFEKVVSVAATDYLDQKAFFSNFGKIEVSAPGVDILSLRASGEWICTFSKVIVGNDYCRLSGTSMAAPHVAGLAAMVLAYKPTFSNALVSSIIQASTDDIPPSGFDIYTGYGRINAYNALLKAEEAVSKPELLLEGLTLQKFVVAPNAPVSFNVEARNAGKLDARNVLVEIFDGDPGLGGVKLGQWVLDMPADTSMPLQQYVTIGDLGYHDIFIVIDKNNAIIEVFEGNNKKSEPIYVADYRSVELPVSTAVDIQSYPDIYGDTIIWTDYRNSFNNADIYMFDISTGQETKVTQNNKRQLFGRIYGDNIVYLDNRNTGTSSYDIYAYNLIGDSESRITTGPATIDSLDIYGNRVVWNQYAPFPIGKYFIYLYNPGAGVEIGNSDCSSGRCYQISSHDSALPGIYEDKVVWLDKRHGYYDIYMYYLGADGEYGTNDCSSVTVENPVTIGGQPITRKIYPLGDGTVREDVPNGIYGSLGTLEVLGNTESADRYTYLDFLIDVGEGVITSAKLYVKSTNDMASTCNTDHPFNCMNLYTSAGFVFDERMLTWENKPALGSLITSKEDVPNGWHIFDVTSTVVGKSTARSAFFLTQSDDVNDLVILFSKETSSVIDRPYLEVVSNLPPVTPPQPGCEGEYQITDTFSSKWSPSIHDNKIVWWDDRNDPLKGITGWNTDIYMYDLGPDGIMGTGDCDASSRCEGEYQITRDLNPQRDVNIYDDKIVWTDYRVWPSGNVFMYDLATRQEHRVSFKEEAGIADVKPVNYGDYVVWVKSTQGNDNDIYMAGLDNFPASPTGLTSSIQETQVTLLWTANIEGDLKMYNIYRGTTQGGPYILLANTFSPSYIDNLPSSGSYYYRVSAIDINDGESGLSNEVMV